jgi:HPt (histidine-containing phosphotransfer) domain-containing protein
MIQREKEPKPLPAPSALPAENLYDLSILQEMDDNDYVIEIITMFLQDTPEELSMLNGAIVAGNFDAVHKKAHKLKSSAGILQAHSLIAAFAELERVAKTEKTIEKLTGLFKNTEQQYQFLQTALKDLLKKMRSCG